MLRTTGLCSLLALAFAALAMLAFAASAFAHTAASGGASSDSPDVESLTCGTGDMTSCPRGDALRISGEALSRVKRVVFLGGRGPADDRSTRPQQASQHRVLVQVPTSAKSGQVRLVAPTATVTGPRLQVLPAAPAPTPAPAPAPAGGGVFPVQGKHDYGTDINRFGGGRGHRGQDVFAACGTPLVSALAGVVTIAKFQERAGNYVVITADDATSQAYMHLAAAATVEKDERVTAGQSLGQVGDTGRANGCHLHFELWTAPGWFKGGDAIDPLPALQGWDTQPRQ